MRRRFPVPCVLLCLLAILPSCRTVRFYSQAIGGQCEILRGSRPNGEVITDAATPLKVRNQLTAVEEIRHFASVHLHLPGNESYGKYADLGREHVVWVLYAAPEFSLQPKTWHYPVLGNLDYRGYFREADTLALSRELKSQGYDVYVGGVDAYSTLGWFHDPVLNTFVDYPDIDIAEIIFHELTHRKIFRHGQTAFNESLANTVGEEGVRRWLKFQGRWADLKKYELRIIRRRRFYEEIDRSRQKLEALYASGTAAYVMRSQKAVVLRSLRGQLLELRRRWGGRGLEGWLNQDINNAHLVSLHIYTDKMPVLQKLLKECGGELDEFYRRAVRLDRE